MKQGYQVADRRDSRALSEFLSRDGQLLLPLLELIERDAFLAYSLNGETENGGGAHGAGYLPRLAFPGKYGYKWVKWLERIELVAGEAGHWAQSPVESARSDGRAAYPFPQPPSCCALYVWGRKRLWQPSSTTAG